MGETHAGEHAGAGADRADQQADERGDRRDGDEGAQPAAKATSSLVSSTASFFMRRKPRSRSASMRRFSAAPSIATTSQAVRQYAVAMRRAWPSTSGAQPKMSPRRMMSPAA